MTELDFYWADQAWIDHLYKEVDRAKKYGYEAVKKMFPSFDDTSEANMVKQYELWKTQGWKEIEDQDRGTGSITDVVRQRIEAVKNEKILTEPLWNGYSRECWWYNDKYYVYAITGAHEGWEEGWRECAAAQSGLK